MLSPWKKSYDQPRQHIKKQRHYFANKGPTSQGYGLPSGHVWMWELDCEESWAPKNWCFWTVVLEKTLESPLDCKKVQPVHPKGDQSWVFFGRNDAKSETPVLWPPNVKSWLIGKGPDAGRDSGQEEKGMMEDEMAGCHHWLGGHEFEWTPGVGDGQGGLVCCSSWGHKELETTEWLNWTDHPQEMSWHNKQDVKLLNRYPPIDKYSTQRKSAHAPRKSSQAVYVLWKHRIWELLIFGYPWKQSGSGGRAIVTDV